MSEDVIGSVIQRKQPLHDSFTVNARLEDTNIGLGQRNYHNVSDCNPADPAAMSSTSQRTLSMQEIRAIADQDTLSELSDIMKAYRDCRKIIQQRHLKKKQKMVAELVESIPKLRSEVKQLQLQRDILSRRLLKETVWSVAIEYFRVFKHGLPELEASEADAVNFLRATMAPDVDMGTTSGIDVLTQNWRIFTQRFPGGHIQLESLRRVANDSLVATTNTSVILTKQTLQAIFPNLREDSKNPNVGRKLIAARLLDQRIAVLGSVRFDWDSTSTRVVRLYTSIDMFSPMLHLLGNLEDVSFAFSGALITPDGNFITEEATQQQ